MPENEPKEVAIITLHGMGEEKPNYYKKLEKKLTKYVGKDLWDQKVCFKPVFYQSLLQGNQDEYWDKIDDKYSLKWDFLREFMLSSFSDASSIEHSLSRGAVLYKAVHRQIAEAFDHCFDKCLGNPGERLKPVFVIAHSLGGEQISNYIWDAMNHKHFFEGGVGVGTDKQRYRRLESCVQLITTGCNIPIFKAGMKEPEVFKQPNDDFKWINYFDRHDVLAYPIRDMSDHFEQSWIVDKKVKVGSFKTGWNPLSHGGYWKDKEVVKPLADEIIRVLT